MIDDKKSPLCCLWDQTVFGLYVPSTEKGSLKHLISQKQTNKKKASTLNFHQDLSFRHGCEPRRSQEWSFVSRLLSLCFWHISTPASHRQSLFSDGCFFFPSYLLLFVQTPISLPRPLCCQYNSAWRDGRAHYRQCLHFFFFFFLRHSSQREIHHGCGMRDFILFFVQTSGSVGGETVSPQCQRFHWRLL